LDDGDLSVLVDEIVDADFNVQFSGTADNILAGGFVIDTQDLWVGLGKSLHTLDELWEITSILWLDSNSNNWGDGVFHISDIVGIWAGGDGTSLGQVFIDTDKGAQVTAWDLGDKFSLSTHHKHSSLDITLIGILLGSLNVVRAEHSNFHTGGNLTGENSSV